MHNNMIQFRDTFEEDQQIHFVVDSGDIVKSYPLEELEKFVVDNNLNVSYEHESYGGTGLVCDPNTNFNEVEVITPVSEYIDDKWLEVTKQFYIAKNPHEFKSETLRRVG